MVIVPIELKPENGKKLEAIVFELAHLNGLEDEFIDWLESSTNFCNSVAERKVPGEPERTLLQTIENTLGYRDQLMIVADADHSWVIEGAEQVKSILSFADADDSIVIERSLERHALRLRMLNEGMHADMIIEKSSVL